MTHSQFSSVMSSLGIWSIRSTATHIVVGLAGTAGLHLRASSWINLADRSELRHIEMRSRKEIYRAPAIEMTAILSGSREALGLILSPMWMLEYRCGCRTWLVAWKRKGNASSWTPLVDIKRVNTKHSLLSYHSCVFLVLLSRQYVKMPCPSSQHKSAIFNRLKKYLLFLNSDLICQGFPSEFFLRFSFQTLIDDFCCTCGRFTYLQLSDSAESVLIVSDFPNISLAAQLGIFVLSINGLRAALTEGGLSIAGLSVHFPLAIPTGYHPSVGERKPIVPTFLPVRAKQAARLPQLPNVYAKCSKTPSALSEAILMYISRPL